MFSSLRQWCEFPVWKTLGGCTTPTGEKDQNYVITFCRESCQLRRDDKRLECDGLFECFDRQVKLFEIEYLNDFCITSFFRSDETRCHMNQHDFIRLQSQSAPQYLTEKLYYMMLNDSDFKKLEPGQQKIIAEGLRQRMCVEKAININVPWEISKECTDYTGR